MTLDEATKLALQTDYAVEAVGPAELNTTDAGAFFLEGYLYAEKAFAKTMEQSGIDISPCRDCGRDVMCYPEGLSVVCKDCMGADDTIHGLTIDIDK